MTSSFEEETDRHILDIATPHECIPACSFKKKFRLHVESEELKGVGVNPLEFTPDSLKLGGAKLPYQRSSESRFFTKSHTSSPSCRGHRPPMGSSRKRTMKALDSNAFLNLVSLVIQKYVFLRKLGMFKFLRQLLGVLLRQQQLGYSLQFQQQLLPEEWIYRLLDNALHRCKLISIKVFPRLSLRRPL